MNTKTFHILSLLFLLVSAACKEVFYADDIVSEEKIPVIQGIILEGESPEVKITWATNYEGNGISYIRDAVVRITDDLGYDEVLEEAYPGMYLPVNGDYKGIRWRTYTLHVELPSGAVFESTPETIKPSAELDSLYAVPVVRKVYELNPSGGLLERKQEGLEIMAALHRTTDTVCYYRFRTDVLTEITYILNPNSLMPTDVFEWKNKILDNAFDVDYSFGVGTDQVVPKHNPGFVEFVYNTFLSSDASTAPYTYGWVVSMHVYSVSANIYNYYNSIAQQLNGTNLIFAPVPSQVKGNIKCISDAKEKVIGAFEACSEKVFYRAFAWKNDSTYVRKDLSDFPVVQEDGRTLNMPPDFWVNLYY